MPKRHPRGWWSLTNFDMFPCIFKTISILTMMISIQRLQRPMCLESASCGPVLGPKFCASRGFESVKPRCLLKICFRRTCLFAPEIRSWGAHQTPNPLVEPQGFSGSGFGGRFGEIPWDPPAKSLEAQNFWTKTAENVTPNPICLDGAFFFKCLAFLPSNQSEWPCWREFLSA